MLLACAAAIRACESGRWRSLLLAGVLVGLAFNTKTLAAYLVVPSIALGYLVCGPAALSRRVLQLLAAGVLAGAVSFAWIAVVEATPASERPYVGSSTDNSELGLTFNYNGFGRVEGQAGGPGQTHGKPGGRVPKSVELRFDRRAGPRTARRPAALAQIPADAAQGRARLEAGPVRRRPAARCGCSASGSATRPAGCCRSPSSG